jgi:hypothetical protein
MTPLSRLGVSLMAGSVAGCSSLAPLEPRTRPLEAGWQVLHAVDMAQTVHIAREPGCYYERGFPTRQVLGSQPSEAGVIAFGIASAYAHRYLSGVLDERVQNARNTGQHVRTWETVRAASHMVALGIKINAVANNHAIGLRPFGRGCH